MEPTGYGDRLFFHLQKCAKRLAVSGFGTSTDPAATAECGTFGERRLALSMGLWNLGYFLMPSRRRRFPKGDNSLRIAFSLFGGLGDFLMAYNYIYCLGEYLGDIPRRIDLFADPAKVKLVQNLFKVPVERKSALGSGRDYDLHVSITRFPRIVFADRKRVACKAPCLLELLDRYEEFYKERPWLDTLKPYADGVAIQYSILEGRGRVVQPDIDGLLGVRTEFRAALPCPEDFTARLQMLELPEKYITVNRGVEAGRTFAENVRMWPLRSFNELVPLLKSYFPGIPVVQLGASPKSCAPIEGVDISLVGKTSLDDLKCVLAHSLLHVDGEGGMVHLRHALKGGPSVVMFGPTSIDLYGYPENLNIPSGVCTWCEWTHDSWNEQCARTCKTGESECMRAIKPAQVMAGIRERWGGVSDLEEEYARKPKETVESEGRGA